MKIDWEPLKRIVADHQDFVLSSHVRPDADAVGSELGLALLLESLGKRVRIVNPSAIPGNLAFLDEARRLMKIGEQISAEEIKQCDVHIVVDTSAWTQLMDVGQALRASPAVKVVIDHHASADDLGAIEFKDTQCEATGILILQVYDAFEMAVSEFAATALFSAISTDTGWFRFPSTTSDTYRAAARLIDAGAKPTLIYQQLYEQRSLARVRLAGRVLDRVHVEHDGRLAYTYVAAADFKDTGAVPADTEDFVNELLKIAGVECAFIAVEQLNRQIKFSLRSRTGVDVSAVAEQFGGGGHKQAAGTLVAGPMKTALNSVLAAMNTALT